MIKSSHFIGREEAETKHRTTDLTRILVYNIERSVPIIFPQGILFFQMGEGGFLKMNYAYKNQNPHGSNLTFSPKYIDSKILQRLFCIILALSQRYLPNTFLIILKM